MRALGFMFAFFLTLDALAYAYVPGYFRKQYDDWARLVPGSGIFLLLEMRARIDDYEENCLPPDHPDYDEGCDGGPLPSTLRVSTHHEQR